jgi:hypothetical protein
MISPSAHRSKKKRPAEAGRQISDAIANGDKIKFTSLPICQPKIYIIHPNAESHRIH